MEKGGRSYGASPPTAPHSSQVVHGGRSDRLTLAKLSLSQVVHIGCALDRVEAMHLCVCARAGPWAISTISSRTIRSCRFVCKRIEDITLTIEKTCNLRWCSWRSWIWAHGGQAVRGSHTTFPHSHTPHYLPGPPSFFSPPTTSRPLLPQPSFLSGSPSIGGLVSN